MNRSEFLKSIATFSLGAPLLGSFLTGCDDEIIRPSNFQTDFKGKVIVIGAGAAGMMAGYLLKQYGVDFQILEASNRIGGRIKELSGFADFPIDLGAEWIHDDPDILSRMLPQGTSPEKAIDLITYRPESIHIWKNEKIRKRNVVSNFYQEYKFKNSTWFRYFEENIVPDIWFHIALQHAVKSIDYSTDKVRITTSNNEEFEADRVLVTVPLKILQNGSIQFNPGLPQSKMDAMDQIDMPAGLKVFIEFKERFYPDILFAGSLIDYLNDSNGDKIFYDAAFRKDSNRNVLGLFTVGEPAAALTDLGNDQAIFEQVMKELDEMYEARPSQLYLQHAVQNWSAEPYIQGSYSLYQGNYNQNMAALVEPMDNKVFFAGEAVSTYASSTVHGAALSSYDALELMLK